MNLYVEPTDPMALPICRRDLRKGVAWGHAEMRRVLAAPHFGTVSASAAGDDAKTRARPSLDRIDLTRRGAYGTSVAATPLSAAPLALMAVVVRCHDCCRAVLVAAGVDASFRAAATGVMM